MLCYGDFAAAEDELGQGLAAGTQLRNSLLQTLCCTYLAVLYRRRNQVEATEHWAQQALAIATSAGIEMYVASAKANLAWVAWRTGNDQAALLNAETASQIWERVAPHHPFRWQAYWPLIGLRLRQGHTDTAVQAARCILVPPQQILPDSVAVPLSAAIAAWDMGETMSAQQRLEEASRAAAVFGYL